MWYWYVLVVWVIGMAAAWFYTRKWDNRTVAEKILYATIWPVVLPLYIVHFINNRK